LLTFIPSMLVVYTLVFGMIHATPGNPWDAGEKPFPPQVLQNLEAKYHVNDPLWKQYVDFLIGAFHGNFGVLLRALLHGP